MCNRIPVFVVKRPITKGQRNTRVIPKVIGNQGQVQATLSTIDEVNVAKDGVDVVIHSLVLHEFETTVVIKEALEDMLEGTVDSDVTHFQREVIKV